MRKPSLQVTYIRYCIISCLVLSLFLLGLAFADDAFTLTVWRGVAIFVVVAVVASVVIGALIGFAIDFYVKRSFNDFSRALVELERGNFAYQLSPSTFREFAKVEQQFHGIAKKLEGQAHALQRTTNERAGMEQEILEQAISQERSRLARELHDSVSQQLFAISMMSSAMNEAAEVGSPLKKQLQVVEEMTTQAQGEMRALLLHLRPIQLEGKKLVDGMKELLTELSDKQHMEISWHIDPIELEKGIEDHLFRILQEGISNTLRHAQARHLEIRLRKVNDLAILRVIDDGIGFHPTERKAGSYGLDSMEERAAEIGGTLKIISIPNKGTQIEVKVLLVGEEEQK